MNWNNEITIGSAQISKTSNTYFIADIAANHDGELSRAKELIYLAKEAGADCAKFQHFLAEKIVSDVGFNQLGSIRSHQTNWKKSVFDIYKQYECRREWTLELVKTAKQAGIEFMTTPYDMEAIEQLDRYLNAYKIGSGDITWHSFLEEIAKIGKPVLLACGASTLIEVKSALEVILKHNSNVVLMQCNTNYTAESKNFKYINLNVLNTFKKEFEGMILGLSDHTVGDTTVLGAVALGARVIEKHFTDDNHRVGPDHKFAVNPKDWKLMVERTRQLELALGDGVKRIEDNEKETVVIQRRAIRLKEECLKGEVVTLKNIENLRPAPEGAYQPYEVEKILGKVLKVDKKRGEALYRTDI